MTETQSTPATNLIIGRTGKSVHLPNSQMPDSPLCGGVHSGGVRQARRRTARPATCQRCLDKADQN